MKIVVCKLAGRKVVCPTRMPLNYDVGESFAVCTDYRMNDKDVFGKCEYAEIKMIVEKQVKITTGKCSDCYTGFNGTCKKTSVLNCNEWRPITMAKEKSPCQQ